MENNFKESIDYWRLCDELTVVQAALLTVGSNPGDSGGNTDSWFSGEYPAGYEPAKTAISKAIKKGLIESEIVPEPESDSYGNVIGEMEGTVDIHNTTVKVDSLREWLASRGFKQGFFFPEPLESAGYLDPNNPRYAPKLAASVRAWEAVTDPGKKSPKQALDKWLRENAADFGLTNEEGKPIELAIEECSKVANWNQAGGAPKTPA